ncbi:MAG: Calx-beta domain-containing protein [Verrucomicrobiota bacterium]
MTTATPDNVLVTQGQLWETMASSARDRANRTMPVAAAALEEAQVLAVGGKLRIKMSPRIPALAAEVSGRSVAPDGTTVTRLHIDGEVPGTLILQNNPATGFFLGQLYYDGLAVAYEFHLVADGLTVTRHEASELVCAFMNATGTAIASRGLPPVDMARVQGAMDVPPDNPTGSPVVAVQLGGKTVTAAPAAPATGSTLSVNDVAMLEGNAGTTNMVFTVNLSQANSKKIVTAKYATANGSATAGADYTALSGTVTFPKGSTTQTIAVPIRGDATVEANETFALILTNPVNATIADATGVGTIIDDDGAPSNVPVHNSLPGAVAVAYLDMDGQVDASLLWSASTIIARGIADTLSQDQMSDIWRRVTEDYAPFQINVTTDERVFLAAPPNCRIRCIITPDSAWYYAVVGGISYVNSFTWPGDVACWVFSDRLGNSPRYIAEACSHEIGHTLGLGHHGRISPAEIYYAGQGSGPVGWAPIMGVGYYQALVQWSKGEYLSSNNSQDDLAIITSQNGFGYRADQNSNTTAGATPLTVSGTVVAGAGIIETRDDVDVFSFTTHGGLVTIEVTGDATSSNLDILAEIKDAAGNTLVAVNPDLLLNASIVTNLSAGTYYLQVSGVGRGDYLVDGYTDYGSLGQYAISGNVP